MNTHTMRYMSYMNIAWSNTGGWWQIQIPTYCNISQCDDKRNNHLPFSMVSNGSCCIHGTPQYSFYPSYVRSFVRWRISTFSLHTFMHLQRLFYSTFPSNQWRISQYELRDTCAISLIYDAIVILNVAV